MRMRTMMAAMTAMKVKKMNRNYPQKMLGILQMRRNRADPTVGPPPGRTSKRTISSVTWEPRKPVESWPPQTGICHPTTRNATAAISTA